jgi:pimeloyl-ACP methyl ester carboxylesterase
MSRIRPLVLAVVGLLLASCGLFDGEPDLSPDPVGGTNDLSDVPEALLPFYTQELDWRDCRGGDQCAWLEVPLDYDRPQGRTIRLSVLKVPASDSDQRMGHLLVNPGGPGGSGVDYAAGDSAYFGDEVLAAFDVVGFDPRGVGESTPLDCLSDAELDEFVASDRSPDTPAEVAAGDRLVTRLLQGCVAHDRRLAGHVGTIDVARDLDVLRSALDEARLTFLGASYGSFIGATYAELFPDRVGRMVLDGAIDPSASKIQRSLAQAAGFETALRAYVEDCVDEDDCFLGDSVEAGVERIQGFLTDLDRQPITGHGERQLTEGLAVLGIWAPLYNEESWPSLSDALETAFRGDGAALLALSDAYTGRGPDGYIDNALEALYAVNCLDHDDAVPAEEIPRYVDRFESVSPTFGRTFASGLSACIDTPVGTGRGPVELRAEGSPTILVVGTTRDPATPLRWAENLAAQLDNAVLVRRDGDGHTGYHAGNGCVDDTVERYLVSGDVPDSTVEC